MKNNSKNLYILYLNSCFGSLIFQRGIFIIYLLTLGFNDYKIGLLQSSLFFSTFIFEIPTGILGDLIGKKKILLLGNFFQIISLFLIILNSTFNYFLLSFILEGMSFAFFSGTHSALFYETITDLDKNYIKTNSMYNFISSLSLGLAILFGAYIQLYSWKLVYCFSLFFSIMNFFCLLFLKEKKNTHQIEKKHFCKNIVLYFKENIIFILFLLTISLLEAITGYFYILSQSLFFSQKLSIEKIAFIYSILQIFSSFIFKISSKISSKFKIQQIFFFIIKASIILMFFVLFNKSYITFILLIIITGFSDCIFINSENYIQNHIPDNIRCSILSIVSFFTVIITSLTYILYGKIDTYFEKKYTFFLLIIPLLISLCTCKIYFKIITKEMD